MSIKDIGLDFLYVCIGYESTQPLLQAVNANEFINTQSIYFEAETQRTSIPGVYLVGTCSGRLFLKHCKNQAYVAIKDIVKNLNLSSK